MAFIHSKPGWPKFTWDAHAFGGMLSEVRHKQGRLLGRMESIGFELRAEASLGTLVRDVVKTSAIEGERLDPLEVRSSLAKRLGFDIAGLPRAGRDVDGVVEMMLDATQGFERLLTADRLFTWHASLFPTGRSGLNVITVGTWRTRDDGPMQVISGPIGRERVHFEAPSWDRLETEMRRFLAWFNDGSEIDPVLKAGVAHLWFVTIHPFADGNGRIARAIADMSLARADRCKERFYSMSAQIEVERKTYYARLESTQRGGPDITPWLEWFLACLGRAIDTADTAMANVLRKSRVWTRLRSLNERQQKVVNRLLDGFVGNLTNARYVNLTRCSPDTALRDIRELVAAGLLAQNPSRGRSTSYRLAEDL